MYLFKMTDQEKIIIYASYLASVAGYNKYETKDNILASLIDKNPFLTNNESGKPEPKMKETILSSLESMSSEKISKLANELNLKDTADANDIEQEIKIKTNKAKLSNTNAESKQELKILTQGKEELTKLTDLMEDDIKMSRGTLGEKDDLDKLQKDDKKVTNRNDKTYSKILFCHGKYPVEIRGKIDGMMDGKIIETKKRRNKLFNYIPIYEKIQLECYIWLTGIENVIHVENYDNESVETQYIHDEKLWNECIQKTKEFLNDNFN